MTEHATRRDPATNGHAVAALVVAAFLLQIPAPARAQTAGVQPARAEPARSLPAGPLTLEQAIELAEARNQQIAVAQAGLTRSEGHLRQARSGFLPQLFGSASYDRTLASEFEGLFGGSSGPACDPFVLRPDAPLGDRVAEIERAIDCGAIGGSPFGGANLGNLPSGQKDDAV